MRNDAKIAGDRLRRTRLALGYTKKVEFSKKIEVDKGDYTKFEAGDRALPLSVGIKIKERFGVSLDWLFCADHTHLSTALYDKIIQIRQAA